MKVWRRRRNFGMEKKKIDIDDVKEFVEDAGHIALGLGIMAGEKAKPYADKIGGELKKIINPTPKKRNDTEKTLEKKGCDTTQNKDVFNADKVLNSVIEGAYKDCRITDKKGTIYIGEKEVSRMNCESYEVEIANDKVEKTKEAFSEYRKRGFNPIARLSSEKYIIIRWRNGDKSVTCVNSSYYDQIIKILS